MSTEKSEKGLAEIYEDEYMKQMHNVDKKKDELDAKKRELDVLFRRICVALDRLCNADFTPAAAVKSLSVTSSAPALAMEEALPISVSTESQKAPEEIYSSDVRVLKGSSEKDKEERERERRVGETSGLQGRRRRRRRGRGRRRRRMSCTSARPTMRRRSEFWRTARFSSRSR